MNLPYDSQRERLVLLMEEMAEAQQIIGKCLRHGMDSTHRDYKHRLNCDLLADELGHVLAAMDLCLASHDVISVTVEVSRTHKREAVKKYLHFQGEKK